MILVIADLLDEGELAGVGEAVAEARFIDGKATAGWSARLVKNNLQMEAGGEPYRRVAALIEAALQRNEVFRTAAVPRVLKPPLISRSDPGMGYGSHVDDALMGSPQVRTDLAYTLFLSRPGEYQGGELIVESPSGELEFKLRAGDMVLYPATQLHRVETVTSGRRLVAAGWVQSCVRDAGQRELLFDLQRARQMVFAAQGKSEAFDLMSKASSNLLRLWSEV